MAISINSTAFSASSVAVLPPGQGGSALKTGASPDSAAVEDFNETSSLSPLSRQLSESAARAAARDSGLSRQQLAAKATELLGQISGNGYFANKQANDAEVPETQDPELLARARAATQFVAGSGKNPFAGLSRDQLALITYDDSGSFTVNERRAAWSESSDQEYAWRQKAVASAMAEYDGTGKLTQFFSAALEHYKGLPAIEQAQYPKSYEAKLQGWIALDFNYKTHAAEGQGSAQDVMDKVLSLDAQTFDEPMPDAVT